VRLPVSADGYQVSVTMKNSAAGADDPMTEIAASAGLLLMFVAVIGVVMGTAVLGAGSVALAGLVIGMALTSFIASLACFIVDAR
jgi:hypothetical protein